MKRFITILSLLLCIITADAQTDNIVRKHSNKPTASKTTPKKPSAAPAKKKAPTATAQKPSKPAPVVSTSSTSNYTPNGLTCRVGGVQFEMIRVQGGTFTMGATSEQGSDAYRDEEPAHQVTLSSYYIGCTEVTQELWKAVMGSNPSYYKGDKRPVENVSWEDCQTFISELNSLIGKRFRLPTEAEWEFAARGGVKSQGYKYSGSYTLDKVAWYKDNSGGRSHDVATKQPNELGLYDMSGNVWEWCSDWSASYSSGAQSDPTGPYRGFGRVYRGGCWDGDARLCRVSTRYEEWVANSRFNYLGLRLCLSE